MILYMYQSFFERQVDAICPKRINFEILPAQFFVTSNNLLMADVSVRLEGNDYTLVKNRHASLTQNTLRNGTRVMCKAGIIIIPMNIDVHAATFLEQNFTSDWEVDEFTLQMMGLPLEPYPRGITLDSIQQERWSKFVDTQYFP